MQTTTNIGLKTYEASDPTDWLGEFNYNMEKIDTAVGNQNDQIDVIEETANTASSTATTANTTATNALNTANTKASIDDNVASASTTYSSNKINALISEIQPGTEIDDTVISSTKTWSSTKINTEVEAVETIANSKASIDDTTASGTATYSSNKISNSYEKAIDIFSKTSETLTVTKGYSSSIVSYITEQKTIENDGYYQIRIDDFMTGSAINNASLRLGIYISYNNNTFEQNNNYNLNVNSAHFSYYSPILYLKAGAKISFTGAAYNQSSASSAPSITSVSLVKYNTIN